MAIKDAASLPYILFCICSSKSCICFPHSYEKPLQWASMCKLPPLLELRLPPLKHLTLLPLFAIPIKNSLSLHFLSAFTQCMHDGCYFLAQCKEVRICTSFPPKMIVFSTTRHFDVLPCIGWILFLSEQILLQLFISYVTVLPSFREQCLQFSYLAYFLGPLFALGQIHLLVQQLCYSAFL